ncbi:unnamed protein product [Scytosiphon promiscuus]
MASMAERSGRSHRTSNGGAGGGARQQQQQQPRIVVPGGQQGIGAGGSRVVDGRTAVRAGGVSGQRGGGGGGRATAEMSGGSRERDRDMEACCRKICTILKEDCKVNFLALDFDLTILDIHTSGRWPGTPEQLTQRIRPFFQALIPVAVAEGMYVGVVTFSPQVSMISSVLKAAFPDVASQQIPIRGDDFSWEYEGRGATDGKQSHMASAAEELTQTHAASITRASTLLVDDDVNNVKIALNEGVKSVWCNPKDPTTMIKDLLGLGNPREGTISGGSSTNYGRSGVGGGGAP